MGVLIKHPNELINSIIRSEFMEAGIFLPATGWEHVGLIADRGDILVDRLPKEGYSLAKYSPSELNSTFYVARKYPLDYATAVFFRGKVAVITLKGKALEEFSADVTNCERFAYHNQFVISYDGGELRLSSREYGSTYWFVPFE